MKFFACIVFAGVLALAVAEGEREARSYAAPSYGHAPVYAGPAKSYTYPSPAPYVPCAKNLLFSCAPSVAPVPCSAPSYHAPSYSAPSYGHGSYLGATQGEGQEEPRPGQGPNPNPNPGHGPQAPQQMH